LAYHSISLASLNVIQFAIQVGIFVLLTWVCFSDYVWRRRERVQNHKRFTYSQKLKRISFSIFFTL